MPTDEVRARYLRDRVLTASPAQRIVMLYDRLGLDLTLADNADEPAATRQHLGHAMQVVAELRASLDLSAGGPAENLASLYGFLLGELVAAQRGDTARLRPLQGIVASLREAWAQAEEQVTAPETPAGAYAGNWVG
jgi:flagellar protein FliS